MTVEAGMNFACHPSWVVDGFYAWICDNWLVGPDGPGERLHRFPQEIVDLWAIAAGRSRTLCINGV